MIATKIAVAMGIVLLGVACWMAVIGVRAVSEGLLTFFALVVLVGGGNYLAGRSGARRGPAPARVPDPPVSGPPAKGANAAPDAGTAGEP